MQDPGTLFVVATPIGNLTDLSRRAEEVLATVQLIACEDTRRTGNLLSLLDLDRSASQSSVMSASHLSSADSAGVADRAVVAGRRLLACHEHNEQQVAEQLLAQLAAGFDVALVSDAGTPLLSDPGFLLVRAAHQRGFPVRPIPGPSAVQALLSVCPLPTERYQFEGFLPARAGKRRARLEVLLAGGATTVLFEAPHRILDTLGAIAEQAPERAVFVGREMTKKFESYYSGTAHEVMLRLQTEDAVRGEFALCVAGVTGAVAGGADDGRLVRALRMLAAEVGPSKAAKILAQLTGRPRSALYDLARQAGSAEAEDGDSR